MAQSLIQTGIDNLKEYINLGGKMSTTYAKNLLTNVFKQYVNVDEVAVNPMVTSINGFVFHIVEREELKFQSDVTDYFVDTNVAVQDHIAWKPVEITLTLQEGEYFNDIQKNIGHSLSYYTAMNTITSLMPKITNTTLARKIKSTISRLTGGTGVINSLANKATSVSYGVLLEALKEIKYNVFSKSDVQEKKVSANIVGESTTSNEEAPSPLEIWNVKQWQQAALLSMESLWRSGMPVQVITSWRTFNDMIITNMKVSRDNNADITEFTITFKEMRHTKSLAVKEQQKTNKGRTSDQKSKVVNNGKTKGKSVTLKGKL